MTDSADAKPDLRRALAAKADDPEGLGQVLADPSITDLDLRHALRGKLPASVSVYVLERSRFGTRQTVLGAVARSSSTAPRTALAALPGLAWRDLADVAVAAELAAAVRHKAETLLLDGLNAMRLGDLVTLSRIGSRRVTTRLLLSAEPLVRAAGLENPRLLDEDVCAILESDKAPREIAVEILRVHRWAVSYQVRLAIVRSFLTPHPTSLPLIAQMNPKDLRDLAHSDDVPPLVSAVARRLLGLR